MKNVYILVFLILSVFFFDRCHAQVVTVGDPDQAGAKPPEKAADNSGEKDKDDTTDILPDDTPVTVTSPTATAPPTSSTGTGEVNKVTPTASAPPPHTATATATATGMATPATHTDVPVVERPHPAKPAPRVPPVNPKFGHTSGNSHVVESPPHTSATKPRVMMPFEGECVPCVRKEFSLATDTERLNFINAFKILAATIQPNGKSVLETLVNHHIDYSKWTHGTRNFLAWHRAYLTSVEKTMKTAVPAACILYWDSPLKPEMFWTHSLFSEQNLGTPTASGVVTRIPDGPLRNFGAGPSSPKVLRNFTRVKDNKEIVLVSYLLMYAFIEQSRDFEAYQKLVSGTAHVANHEFVGGHMATMRAPGDPIFFLHHGMLDMYWYIFQTKKDPDFNDYPDLHETLPLYNIPVSAVMNPAHLCYSYEYDHSHLDRDPKKFKPPTTTSDETFDMFLGQEAKNIRRENEDALKKARTLFATIKELPKFQIAKKSDALAFSSTSPYFHTAIILALFYYLF